LLSVESWTLMWLFVCKFAPVLWQFKCRLAECAQHPITTYLPALLDSQKTTNEIKWPISLTFCSKIIVYLFGKHVVKYTLTQGRCLPSDVHTMHRKLVCGILGSTEWMVNCDAIRPMLWMTKDEDDTNTRTACKPAVCLSKLSMYILEDIKRMQAWNCITVLDGSKLHGAPNNFTE